MKRFIKLWILIFFIVLNIVPNVSVKADDSNKNHENEITVINEMNSADTEMDPYIEKLSFVSSKSDVTFSGIYEPESVLYFEINDEVYQTKTQKDGTFKFEFQLTNEVKQDLKITNDNNQVVFIHKNLLEIIEKPNKDDQEVHDDYEQPNIHHKPSLMRVNKVGTSYYIVQPGDNIDKISKSFNINKNDLISWNNLGKKEVQPNTVISVNGPSNYSNIFKGSRKFSSTKEMINQLVPLAKDTAAEYGLYPSVLIAQAILETGSGNSNLALLANNYFGIKGSYVGNSISSLTTEEINGVLQPSTETFRIYPNLEASVTDYAKRLRYGPTTDSRNPSWSKEFYNGTWIENTGSYKDATAWLSQKWATDSQYANKLNNIIQTYSLYMYDDHLPILSTKNVNYVAQISKAWSINTKPWGTKDYEVVSNFGSYHNSWVNIKQEKTTIKGTYALIELNGREIGWIDVGALTKQEVLNTREVNYPATIVKDWSISTLPWGTEGSRTVGTAYAYLNKRIQVTKEKDTPRSTYVLVEYNGKDIGWVDKDALNLHPILSTKNVNYAAKINKSWSITSKPWGSPGYKSFGVAQPYLEDWVQVKKEQVTPRSTYALIELNGKELGWIDTGALLKQQVLSTRNTDYNATVTKAWSLSTLPWGIEGYNVLGTASNLLGKSVKVIQEKDTLKSMYALIELNGKELGWIDKDALNLYPILATKRTNYMAKVSKAWSISTQPWGSIGSESLGDASKYLKNWVLVKEEKTTPRSVYGLIEINGKEIGWLDIGALTPQKVLSSRKSNYAATVNKAWSVSTLPWGIQDFKVLGDAASILGETVFVIEEKVTPRSTYGLIQINQKEIGWIDLDALDIQQVLSTKDTNYAAKVTIPWSISTLPWGVEGFEVIGTASNYLNKIVTVKQEKVTPRSTYALIELDGKELGWIDSGALNKQRVISNRKIVYDGVVKLNQPIHSKPFGVEGSSFLSDSSAYIGKTVKVSQESDTVLGSYVLININNKEIGWISKESLDIFQVVLSTRNVNYAGTITKGWSINSLPWGVPGSQSISINGEYVGSTVEVIQEKETPRSVYALIKINGKEIGWLDTGAIEKQRVLSTKNVDYYGVISKAWSISSLPWGVEGYNVIGTASPYLGETVTITQEKVTPRSTYALVKLNDRELGWIDTGAIEKIRVLTTKNTNYRAKVERGWSISTLPWGVEGSKLIRDASAYIGQTVTVLQEQKTPRSTYGLISISGQTIGWLDLKALKPSKVVYLDAGHGGSDSGAFYGGIAERDINLDVSKKIASKLESLGYIVIMSRDARQNSYHSDPTADLFERANQANRSGADIYVSVHHNAMPQNSNVTGIETFYYGASALYPPLPGNSSSHIDPVRLSNSRKLASSIQNELIGSTKANNRGVKTGAFIVLRETKMPAVLLELGFMSNANELRKLSSNSYQNTLADAVVKGINKYFDM